MKKAPRLRSGQPRRAAFDRRTTETQIAGELVLDGAGKYSITTGIRFFDHMLELFAEEKAMAVVEDVNQLPEVLPR
jgi:imidazoleglycerol-phosphate dehydratase